MRPQGQPAQRPWVSPLSKARVSVAELVQETALVDSDINKPTGFDAAGLAASDGFFVKPPAFDFPRSRSADKKFEANPSSGLVAQNVSFLPSLRFREKPEKSLYRYQDAMGRIPGLCKSAKACGIHSINRM